MFGAQANVVISLTTLYGASTVASGGSMSRSKVQRYRNRRRAKRIALIAVLFLSVIGSVLIAFAVVNRTGGDGGGGADVEAAP